MDFLIDAMLPMKLCDLLKNYGHNSIHTSQLPDRNSTSDNNINQVSLEQNLIVVTKDSDFEDDIRIRNIPYKLLIIKTGNISNENLLNIFKDNIDEIIKELGKSKLVEINSLSIISHF